MKKHLLSALFASVSFLAQAQVTQLNADAGLEVASLLDNSRVILEAADHTLWVSNATNGGTFQLSPGITYEGAGAVINNRFVFAGRTAAAGIEMFVTDGTTGGTALLLDINAGPMNSTPDNDVAILNGFVYFTAERPQEGREIWRTNGTTAGTTLVKDIYPGPLGSNVANRFELFSTGTYLLFAAASVTEGTELWRSDGTNAGTVLLKNINANATSSNPSGFHQLGNTVFFQALDATRGTEVWKTDGTSNGTVILKDINPGPAGSASLFGSIVFYTFNNKVFFTANDGEHGPEIWSSDGTEANTSLLQDIQPGPDGSYDLLTNAIRVGNKFIFPSTDFFVSRNELWESDGTTANTKRFMSFDGGNIPFIYPAFDINGPLLYQGRFFFVASTANHGYELWISDGTVGGTSEVKDINPGTNDGVLVGGFIYTTAGLYFAADNGVDGTELWKSDGTYAGTVRVADINPGGGGSDPQVFPVLVNNRIILSANDGSATDGDFFAVNGIFNPLPVKLTAFTGLLKNRDALLQWSTSQESNSRDFIVERSLDGTSFTAIGTVAAAGNSSVQKTYTLTDAGIAAIAESIIYYRLRSRDLDGKFSLSSVITLRVKESNTLQVKILTNPVADQLRVVLSGVRDNVQLQVMDMTGRKQSIFASTRTSGQLTLNTAALPSGTYLLLVNSGQQTQTIQFLK